MFHSRVKLLQMILLAPLDAELHVAPKEENSSRHYEMEPPCRLVWCLSNLGHLSVVNVARSDCVVETPLFLSVLGLHRNNRARLYDK